MLSCYTPLYTLRNSEDMAQNFMTFTGIITGSRPASVTKRTISTPELEIKVNITSKCFWN
jgi:hypothetical protein